MKSENKYTLMMVYVDRESKDVGRNSYPLEGLVRAEKFVYDKNIQTGLCGIPWGKTTNFIYEDLNSNQWLVVKVDINSEVFYIDEYRERFKFKEGIVLCHGKLSFCAEFILNHLKENKKELIEEFAEIKPEDVAGSDEWKIKNKKRIEKKLEIKNALH